MMSLKLVETRRKLVGSRTDTAGTCRNVVLNSTEFSGLAIVLHRSDSYDTRSNACYVVVLNAREPTTLLSDLYHSLQMRYEIRTTYAPTIACDYRSAPENLKQFKILVGTPRQPTSYGEKLTVVYDNWRHMASSL